MSSPNYFTSIEELIGNNEKTIETPTCWFSWAWASVGDDTLEFLDKKCVKFDQGLNFLILYQENRRKNREKLRKTKKK